MRYALILTLLLTLGVNENLRAEDIDQKAFGVIDAADAAHIGSCYLINTVAYGIFSRGMRLSRTDAVVMSFATTLMIGVIKEVGDAVSRRGPIDGHDVIMDGLGAGLSSITILSFNF